MCTLLTLLSDVCKCASPLLSDVCMCARARAARGRDAHGLTRCGGTSVHWAPVCAGTPVHASATRPPREEGTRNTPPPRRVRYTFTLHATHSLVGALLTFSCHCPLSSHHHCRHRQAHQPASATASASVPPPSLDKSPWLLRFRAEKILIFYFCA